MNKSSLQRHCSALLFSLVMGAGAAWAELPGPAGSIVGWGVEDATSPGILSDIPAGNDFVDVSAGAGHAIALRRDGSLVGWGRNKEKQINVPAGNDFIDIATGITWSAALRNDGTITVWGTPAQGRPFPPDRNDYVRFEPGYASAYAIVAGGERFGFGTTFGGLLPELDTSVAEIASTIIGEAALYPDGSMDVRTLGYSTLQHYPTGSDFIDVTGGYATIMARRNTGEVIWWGNDKGQIYEPTAVDMSWGFTGGLILRADGSIRTLGGLAEAPIGKYFYADAGGASYNYALALTPEPSSLIALMSSSLILIRRR